MTTTYPHVTARQLELIERYGEYLTNTGGNPPAELLADLNRPGTDERPNRLMSTNVVRFTLAVAVQSQIALLDQLEQRGVVA